MTARPFTGAALLLCARSDEAKSYPPVRPPGDPSPLGTGVQRTMTRLAASTATKRNKVKVLFYGQSITEQNWSKRVADDLRRRFPHADLEIENRAIGGFSSQRLVRTAEHDLYPFYPDLLIFHVYGGNNEYEQIIKNVRTRTTSEILMQTDHVAAAGVQETPDEKANKGLWWDWMMNHQFLPAIAKKYDCGLVDVRSAWLDYLRSNKLEPKTLLSDGVHLNDWGNAVMAALIQRHLVHRPELSAAAAAAAVRTLVVGKDIDWKNNRLVVPFEGDRVDVLARAGINAAAPARVRIDGKNPSKTPDLFCITRPAPGPWSPLTVIRIDHDAPLQAENWTLKISSVSADSSQWTFAVSGSLTGPDGSGNNNEPFTSRSGRVKIAPGDFFGKGTIPGGYAIKWRVLPLFADTIAPPPSGADPAREHVVTLAQGLSNGPHTLEISAANSSAATLVAAVRVFRPPFK